MLLVTEMTTVVSFHTVLMSGLFIFRLMYRIHEKSVSFASLHVDASPLQSHSLNRGSKTGAEDVGLAAVIPAARCLCLVGQQVV